MAAASTDRTLSIIIPAKNESKAIGDLVADIGKLHPEAEIVVVDDGSDDDTAEIAAGAGARGREPPGLTRQWRGNQEWRTGRYRQHARNDGW